jgi:hypothetical protein
MGANAPTSQSEYRIELIFFLKKRKEVQASCSLSKEKVVATT